MSFMKLPFFFENIAAYYGTLIQVDKKICFVFVFKNLKLQEN